MGLIKRDLDFSGIRMYHQPIEQMEYFRIKIYETNVISASTTNLRKR